MEERNQAVEVQSQGKSFKTAARKALPLFVGIVIGCIATYLLCMSIPESDNQVIQCTKENGKYQKRLMELPSVAQFINFTKYAEQKDTTKMWESLYANKRNLYGDKIRLLYDYSLVHDYEIRYIIPESENSFYVWFRFTDNIDESEIPRLKNYPRTKIKDLYGEKLPEELVDEVYSIIDKRFLIGPDYTKDSVKHFIRDYMNNMSMSDFIYRDWRFPIIIASMLRLKPCPQLGCYSRLQSHELLSLVEMGYDSTDNGWKVKTWDTKAISRWR